MKKGSSESVSWMARPSETRSNCWRKSSWGRAVSPEIWGLISADSLENEGERYVTLLVGSRFYPWFHDEGYSEGYPWISQMIYLYGFLRWISLHLVVKVSPDDLYGPEFSGSVRLTDNALVRWVVCRRGNLRKQGLGAFDHCIIVVYHIGSY